MRGRFITFEGGEGVGKSTQVTRLAERLSGLGREVVATREPGGTPRAERLRAALLSGGARRFGPFAETLLLASARADHVDAVIRPALERGADVLCDRFADSTRAYQGVAGGVDQASIEALERLAVRDTTPDLTLVFDAPVSVGLQRARSRLGEGASADRFEAEDAGFHERLRDAFLDIALREPQRCVLIDATAAPDAVAESVWASVSRRFGIDGAERAAE
jgi:dTMP kinase